MLQDTVQNEVSFSGYTPTNPPTGVPQKSNKETCERIVVFLDIMGFKDMVARQKETSIIDKLEDLTNFISQQIKEKDILFYLFSDSIILFSDEIKEDTFTTICHITNKIVEHSISLGLPIKGAMSKGMCTVSTGKKQFYFGQPIIDAYLLEENVVLYGVVLHNTIEETADNHKDTGNQLFIDFKTPLKGGSSKHYILNWFGQDMDQNREHLNNIRKSVCDSPRRYIDNTESLMDEYIRVLVTEKL